MSLEAMNHVWKHTNYPAAQSYILQAIADVVNDTYEHRFFMTVSALAQKTKCSDRTIQRTLSQFVSDGWLSIEVEGGGRGNATEYRFHFLKGDNLTGFAERVTGETVKGDNSGTERVTNEVSIHLLELNNNSTNNSNTSKVFSDEVISLGEYFSQSLMALGCAEKPVTSKWLSAFEKMIRLDGRTAEQIRKAIDWAHGNSFWAPNIQSPEKLRDKYDQMRLQAIQAKKGKGGQGFDLMKQEFEKEQAKERAEMLMIGEGN